MAPTDCLYHSDQNGFGSMQKELVQCGWLPRKCSHRLAMAVCSCRKKLADSPSYDEHNLNCEKLRDVISTDSNNIPGNVVSFINDCINYSGSDNFSQRQFVSVLCKARNGDLSMLSRASISTNSKISERDLQREINRNKKLTKYQIDIIIKKKKRKEQAFAVKLPIFPGNLSQVLKLEFVTKQRKHIIEPDYTKNNENFDNNKTEAVIKIWGNPDNFKTLAARMIEEAKAIQMNMDKERERRKRIKAARKLQYASLYDVDDDWGTADFKETLTHDFSVKVHKNVKGKVKSQIVKAQSSVLDGGHCLQCFKPFTNLHDGTECKYHSGFTILDLLTNKKKWSCCDTYMTEENTERFDLHNSTGCSTSRVHSWRTHAKSKGKDRDQMGLKHR